VTNPKEIDTMSLTTESSAESNAMRQSAERLSVYFNDHLADETFGVELVKRAISENTGTPPLRAFLEVLSWELEEDREILVRLMDRLGVRRKRVRVIFAWIAEKVGRLRLNGYSPASALAELESLHVVINGKIDMWTALRSSVGDRAGGIDFDELVHRAERQAEELERRRLEVAADALSYQDRSAAAHISSAARRRQLTQPKRRTRRYPRGGLQAPRRGDDRRRRAVPRVVGRVRDVAGRRRRRDFLVRDGEIVLQTMPYTVQRR
jgi:hypothetical protein